MTGQRKGNTSAQQPAGAASRRDSLPATARLRPELPEAAFYGLAGDVARELSLTTGADPAALLLQILTMIGNAVGPQPHVRFGGVKHSARLFLLLVGAAGTGLKGTSLRAEEELLEEADPEWFKRIERGIQSPEGMIELVADGTSGDCRLLLIEYEYSRLVSRTLASGTFSAHLRNAFDGSQLQVTRRRRSQNDQRSSLRASNAHISLIAHITPEELSRTLLSVRRAGGLETRLLYGLIHRQAEVNPFQPQETDHGELVERIRTAIESSRARVLDRTDPISRELCMFRGIQPQVEMPVARAVSQNWEAILARLPKVHPDYEALVQRGPTLVIRLALCLALANGSTFLSQEHIDPALAIFEYCARSAERIFGVPTGSLQPEVDPRLCGRLVDYLSKENGAWVPREEIIVRLFHRNISKTELDAIVGSLKAQKLIRERRVPNTGGRPRIEYRVTDPPKGLSS